MKKLIVISLIAIFVLSMGVMAFAETADETPEWFTEMIKWKKEQVAQAVEDKVVTEEQAKLWNDRLDAMVEYHAENGFAFPGGCGASGRGFGRVSGGRGFGPGMRGGYFNTQGL